MSIWTDIEARSAGNIKRKEDEYQDVLEFSDPVNLLTFIGNIDESTIPSFPLSGQVYHTNDKISINGVTFPSGHMILFDGNNWHDIGIFQETIIDSNIRYYQPINVKESSII